MRSLVLLVALTLLMMPADLVNGQEGLTRIQAIEIRGSKRIDEGAIRDRLTVKIGDTSTDDLIRAQIRNVYDMGFFDDVQVRTEPVLGGAVLVVVVREKPFITEIEFDGNDRLKTDELREQITVRGQTFLDKQSVKESAEKIEQAYRDQAFYNAEVIPIVQSLDQDRRRLTFYIKEGKQTKIETVNFVGAEAISKKEFVDFLANREKIFVLSWFTDAGILKREELGNDVARIRRIYLNRGYFNAQVSQPTIELTEDKEGLILTFRIVEGEQFSFDTLTFEGNSVFEDAELRVGTRIVRGEVFSAEVLVQEKERIEDLYGKRGYSFAEAAFGIKDDRERKTIDVAFSIEEGKLMRIRRINITGNDKTRDNVIRRELRVEEQQVIDTVAMKRSFQRLNNVDFFETVEILPTQVADDKVDIDVKVKEKPTGTFSIGGGFSTLDQFTLVANIRERNLFGRGHMLQIRGQLGQKRQLGVITFREPSFRDGPMSLQFDLYNTDTDFNTYNEKKTGGSIAVGRFFSEYLSGSLSLFAEFLDINDVALDAPSNIKQQSGKQSSTGFRSRLIRDTRDFVVDPRTGWRMDFGFDFAWEGFGGSNNFYKPRIDVLKYTPLFWDTRHMIRGRHGVVHGFGGEPEPVPERFFVGGINTLRGFKFGRAGPVTITNDPEGGNRQIILNNDFIFPVLAEAKLNGVLFFDYGEGYNSNKDINLLDLRTAAGLEVRWLSPFGPLRASYGWNLSPRDGEKKAVFEFSVGSLF